MNIINIGVGKKYLIELYKLNLPANVVNKIADYYYNQINCDNCKIWKQFQRHIDCYLDIKKINKEMWKIIF